jgi:hypothetical protein
LAGGAYGGFAEPFLFTGGSVLAHTISWGCWA